MVDLNKPYTVSKENLLYKCGWSPLEGHTFNASIMSTMINGNMVLENGIINAAVKGKRLAFNRE